MHVDRHEEICQYAILKCDNPECKLELDKVNTKINDLIGLGFPKDSCYLVRVQCYYMQERVQEENEIKGFEDSQLHRVA